MTFNYQRHFRRYPKDADLTLKFKNKHFKAKMINYTPDGISAIIENATSIGKGDAVEITAMDPKVRISGEIVWSLIDKSVLRFGVKNVGSLEGLTKDYALTDLLIGLQRGNRTGILTMSSGDIVRKIYIKNGDMIFSASNQEEDRLGYILLREGKITKDQFDQAVIEMKRTGQKKGMVLVRLGYLAPADLVIAVQHQIEHIIERLFDVEDGRYEFHEGFLPSEEVITLKLSAANLIYHGMKKINDTGRIQKRLPSMEYLLDFSPNPQNTFPDLMLDDTGIKIISCIDGKTSIEDIISITQLDSLEVLKTLYALLSIGTIELHEKCAACMEMPEMVHADEKGFETLSHDNLGPVLIEAVKEQQAKIERQRVSISEQQKEIKAQNAHFEALLKEKDARIEKLEGALKTMEKRLSALESEVKTTAQK